jgi:hypothetical protein
MDKQLCKAGFIAAAVLAVTSCSTAPKPSATETKVVAEAKKEPPKPSGPVAAQTAFYEMYKPARSWATDVMPLSLVSGEATAVKNVDGKAAVWTAVFVSSSRREARTFTYSTVDDGEIILRGVSAGGAQAWSGATAHSKPFQSTEFLVNSDAAFKTAATKAEAWLKKNPDKKWGMALGSSSRFPRPVWFILWGNTKSGYAAYVDATTGILGPK